MKWFKHPSDAHRTKGMMKLRQKYGAEGLGLYWYCVECIAAPIDKHRISFELEHDVEVLAGELSIDTLRCAEIMQYMCRPDVGLFVSDQLGTRIFCFYLAQMIEGSIVKNPALKLVQQALKDLSGGGQVTVDDILALPGIVGNPGQAGTIPEQLGKAGPDGEGDTEGNTDTTAAAMLFTCPSDGGQIAAEWEPAPDLVEYLGDTYSVPPSYALDYGDRFKLYWHTQGTPRESWAALFIEQCSQRWEAEKASYMGGELVNWSPYQEPAPA